MAKSNSKEPIEGEVIKKRGRPRKYTPEMGDVIVQVGQDGGGIAKMCQAINVGSYETFYRWIDEYPDFREAYNKAKMGSLAFYEDILLAGGLGRIKGFNFNSIAMIMNNKFPDFYSRGTGAGSNTNISIGSINSIEKLSTDELDKKIEALQKKLKILPGVSDNE